MALTTAQKTLLATGLKAETDAGVVAAMAIRNDVFLSSWCNAKGSTDVWNTMTGTDLFQQTDVTKFDNITQGKRDSWRLMLDFSPVDFGLGPMRKAVVDVWGNVDSVTVLQGCRRKGTHGEVYIGGSVVTTNTVSATKLDFVGSISITEMSQALNENP
jgi:hypothetical protein